MNRNMAVVSPNSDSNEMKAEMPEGTTATTTTTTTTTTISTTTATSDSATTDAVDDASVTEKKKEGIGENPDSLCPNLENLEKEQPDSDSAVKSTLPDVEKLTAATTANEEVTATVVRSPDDNNVSAVDDSITSEVTTAAPASEIIANEATDSQDSNTSASETEKLDFCAAAEHNSKVITDLEDTVSNQAAASGDSISPGTQPNAVAESPIIATTTTPPSAGDNKENDTMADGKTEATGEEALEKGLSDAAEKKESSAAMNDSKELAGIDDTDQFMDAKSPAAQVDVASESDVAEISGDKKEQSEVVQDEEGDEYDEEEQEAEPDDDEIEGNPAYIPKSGRYYMHDSRNTNEERTPEPSSRSRADGKWKHDRFDERSQRPKTKRELMNRYGYDIRNEGNKTTGGNIDGSTPNSNTTNRTRGASRGASHTSNRGGGGRGRYSNRAPPQHQQQQHQQNVRSNFRRQDGGAGRPGIRGGRRGEHHPAANHQRVQPGTRVFKNSPTNAQRGATSRTDNYRSYDRGGDNRRSGGENRRGGGVGVARGGVPSIPERGGGAVHTGGKRYSTQRLATSYAPDTQQPLTQPPPPQPQPPPPQQLQSTPTTGPIPIPPPDWRPPAFQGPIPTAAPPPPPQPPPPPPPIAVAAPVHNFRSSDIVYFDPQPQQLYRNPMPPRAKKRLEIVPPYQAKNSN